MVFSPRCHRQNRTLFSRCCILSVLQLLCLTASASTPARLVVIGGGAAGYFGACRAASACGDGALSVTLLEAGARTLTKVSISGGGRCNVCHDETKERADLSQGYPRGERAMLAALSRFGAPDAARWFRDRGVALKTESDGRMFPQSDDSASIVHALTHAANDAAVDVLMRAKVIELNLLDDACDDERFEVAYVMRDSTQGSPVTHRCRCRYVLMATGGSPEGLALLSPLKQPLVAPVPSLFTFRLATANAAAAAAGTSSTAASKQANEDATAAFDWQGLAGVSVPCAQLRLDPVTENGNDDQGHSASAVGTAGRGMQGTPNGVVKGTAKAGGKAKRKGKGNGVFRSEGPLLFTHRGISGPAVLRLSAFGARVLHEAGYRGEIVIDWVGLNEEQAFAECARMKSVHAKRGVATGAPAAMALPRRLWGRLVASAGISAEATWADASKAQLRALARALCATRVLAAGKDMNKDEFVTAGGVDLKGVEPRRSESRLHAGLFFAGEVLDVDGVTGGYNFQNAWTSSWIAGSAIADDVVARRVAAAAASDAETVGLSGAQ